MSRYLLSICIPTKDRPENIDLTLKSILSEEVDQSFIQIVISDNSTGNLTLNVLKKYSSLNIKYYRNPILGFFNSIEALKQGDGDFLKLQNDYSAFKKGGLKDVLRTIEYHLEDKTQILFTGGSLGLKNNTFRTNDFNKFLQKSQYFNTWSTAFSIWKQDLDKLIYKNDIYLNDQFPHTSLLLENNNKGKYLIYDKEIYDNKNVAGKGGYNIFYNFCVVYPSILHKYVDNKIIDRETLLSIKNNMKYKFVGKWLARTILCDVTKHNYSFNGDDHNFNISKCYGMLGLYQIKIFSFLFSVLLTIRSKFNVQ